MVDSGFPRGGANHSAKFSWIIHVNTQILKVSFFSVMFGPKMKAFLSRLAARRMGRTRGWFINKAQSIIDRRKEHGVSICVGIVIFEFFS